LKEVCLVSALTLGLVSVGCCDRTTRRVPDHLANPHPGYILEVSRVTRDSEGKSVQLDTVDVRDQRGTCVRDDTLVICNASEHFGFMVEISNAGDAELRVLWPNGSYVDERQRRHVLFRQPVGPLPHPDRLKPSEPIVLRNGSTVRDIVVPIDKQYVIAYGCREYTEFHEPLIPASPRGLSEAALKDYIADLAKRQVPVKLVLPILVGKDVRTYTFWLVLRQRYGLAE
jgi:hypothetical protein